MYVIWVVSVLCMCLCVLCAYMRACMHTCANNYVGSYWTFPSLRGHPERSTVPHVSRHSLSLLVCIHIGWEVSCVCGSVEAPCHMGSCTPASKDCQLLSWESTGCYAKSLSWMKAISTCIPCQSLTMCIVSLGALVTSWAWQRFGLGWKAYHVVSIDQDGGTGIA